MKNIVIQIADVEMNFAVEVVRDDDNVAPWITDDGHGPVTDWEFRSKKPSEVELNSSRGGAKRYYNMQEACAMALRDGWGCKGLDGTETKRQKAAKAAQADFEHLQAWCNDDWYYVGVIVTLLDSEGNKTEVSDCIWRVESGSDEVQYQAETLADELAHGLHTRFEVVTTEVQSFKMI